MFLSSGTRNRSGHTWQNDWLLDLARNREASAQPSNNPPLPSPPPPPHDDDDSADGDNDGPNTNWMSESPELSSDEWDDEPASPTDPNEPSTSHGGGSGDLNRPTRNPGTSHPLSKGRRRFNRGPARKRRPHTPSGADTSTSDWAAEVAALRFALQQAQSDLRAALEELEDARQLNQHLVSTNDDLQAQRRLLVVQIEDINQSKDFQNNCLREQLDQAHFKLRKAERRNRYVDDTDRWKADAKYKKKRKVQETTDLLFGFPTYEPDEHKEDVLKERRGAQGLVAKSVTVVTAMMNRFNEELFQIAASVSDMVDNMGFERASMLSTSRERAERVLGARLVSMILPTVPQARKGTLLNPLVVQVVIQAFLAYWCNSIIEAWYPKQASFAEFLVDLSSKLKVGTNRNICGRKTIITQKHTRDSSNLFDEWVKDIIEDLDIILSIFGWRFPQSDARSTMITSSASSVFSAILSIVREAYDIRTAMAEISTSGDVDLVIVSYDTPYNELWMDDAYGDYRKRNTVTGDLSTDPHGKTVIESVVATTGIGLQREMWKTDAFSGLASREIEMVLKPRVVLEYTLLEGLMGLTRP